MNLVNQIRRDFARLLANGGGNVADVTGTWNEADLSTVDPNLEGTYPVQSGSQACGGAGTWPAMVHYIQPISTGIRQFAEMQVGDVILDFQGDVAIPANASGARFRIEGDPQTYVQKQVGKDLADAWDMVIAHQRVLKTYLVTRESG